MRARDTERLVACALPLSVLFTSVPAFAGGPPPTCVHQVPIGSHVNSKTGNVTDDAGTLLAHYEPGVCDPSDPTMNVPHGRPGSAFSYTSPATYTPSSPAPASYTGWIEGVIANPVDLGGVKAFDNMSTLWYVPNAPSSVDGQVVFLWPGMEICTGSGSGCPTWNQIIQPVLGFNQFPEDDSWTIVAEAVDAGNPVPFTSSSIGVSSGDLIYGLLEMVSSTEWLILTSDQSSGQDTMAGHLCGYLVSTPRTRSDGLRRPTLS